MAKLQVEESNKNREAIIADNALRDLPEEEVIKVLKWWDRFRGSVGWRRMSKVMTAYAKEFRAPYVKESDQEKPDEDEYNEDDFSPEVICNQPKEKSFNKIIPPKPNRRIIKHGNK